MSTGLTIQKSSSIFTVGKNASFICSTDHPVVLIEWIYNFQILTTSSLSELHLTFDPVNDTIHGNEYSCRVTTPYGIQEQTVQVVAQSKCRRKYMLLCVMMCIHELQFH